MNQSCASCGAAAGGEVLSGLCAACLLTTAATAITAAEAAESSTPHLLGPGSTVGPYEIVSMLGHGGMGHVYLAWDARLCRTVAIKVLPPPFTADAERTRRLEREARIVAGLNHPRICAVHDLGCDHGLTYIVMEHLQGETLAERLTRGPLPLADVLTLSIEIADGLDRAHRQGITHRDLKPANIMLTRSGAKLLDFGLAARAYTGGSASLAALKGCATASECEAGVAQAFRPAPASDSEAGVAQAFRPAGSSAERVFTLGGTVQYMSPEQLEGKRADVRSDVFAFGLVLYEMLTAQMPCGRLDATRLSSLRPDVPPALDRIVRRCVQRNPDDRWQSLRDVSFELTAVVEDLARPVERTPPAPRRRSWTSRLAVAAALTAVVVGVLVVPALATHRATPPRAIRFAAAMPRPASEVTGTGGMAFVSPDGLSLAWMSAGGDGKTTLAVQPFDAVEPTMLSGTDGARWPFWSPDSRAIAFFAQGELRTVQASGGPVETIAKAPFGAGGSWSSRGTMLFAPDRMGTIYEVAERGGQPVAVTSLAKARAELSHQWPVYLPDARHFVYFVWSDRPEYRGLYLADRETRESRWLGPADGGAVWAPPHHLLFTRAGMLVAQPFDLNEMRLVDEPRVVQDHVCGSGTIMPPCFSASTTGMLVYHAVRLFRHQLAWFTRSGRQLDIPIEPGSYTSPVLSADGLRVALDRHDPRTWRLGIWQFDLTRRTLSRMADESTPANGAVWSPDGRALAFSTDTIDRHEIDRIGAQGGSPERLYSAPKQVLLTDWSSDGKHLLFQMRGDGSSDDVWVMPVDGSGSPSPYLHSRFGERQARFAPDGRWVAYVSDESGRPEVYVQPFPATGTKWQISNDGGHQPTWRRDGRELFYLSGERRLTAVAMRTSSGLTVGAAQELFRVPRDAPIESRISYAPDADGQRFLVNVAAPDRVRLPMFETQVVVNWPATLR